MVIKRSEFCSPLTAVQKRDEWRDVRVMMKRKGKGSPLVEDKVKKGRIDERRVTSKQKQQKLSDSNEARSKARVK